MSCVLPAEELIGPATAAAGELADKPVQALAATRRLLKGDLDEILARKDRESAMFRERLQFPEAQAIFAGFLAGTLG